MFNNLDWLWCLLSAGWITFLVCVQAEDGGRASRRTQDKLDDIAAKLRGIQYALEEERRGRR